MHSNFHYSDGGIPPFRIHVGHAMTQLAGGAVGEERMGDVSHAVSMKERWWGGSTWRGGRGGMCSPPRSLWSLVGVRCKALALAVNPPHQVLG